MLLYVVCSVVLVGQKYMSVARICVNIYIRASAWRCVFLCTFCGGRADKRKHRVLLQYRFVEGIVISSEKDDYNNDASFTKIGSNMMMAVSWNFLWVFHRYCYDISAVATVGGRAHVVENKYDYVDGIQENTQIAIVIHNFVSARIRHRNEHIYFEKGCGFYDKVSRANSDNQ